MKHAYSIGLPEYVALALRERWHADMPYHHQSARQYVRRHLGVAVCVPGYNMGRFVSPRSVNYAARRMEQWAATGPVA